jgi:hypothetical protein
VWGGDLMGGVVGKCVKGCDWGRCAGEVARGVTE